MPFDLHVGTSLKAIGSSSWVGQIECMEMSALAELMKLVESNFLVRLQDLYADQEFSSIEVGQALLQLLPLLEVQLSEKGRALLQKLIAVLAYANSKNCALLGAAD